MYCTCMSICRVLLDNMRIKSNVQGIYTVYIKFTTWKPIIAVYVQGLSGIQDCEGDLLQWFDVYTHPSTLYHRFIHSPL